MFDNKILYWTDYCIKQPVLPISAALIILILGLISYSRLSIRLFPYVPSSVVRLKIEFPGVPAQTMENQVSTKIFDVMNNLEGLDYIQSRNIDGLTEMQLHFKMGHSVEKDLIRISENLKSVEPLLPHGIYPPQMLLESPDQNPDLLLAFTDANKLPEDLNDYLTRTIKPLLNGTSGVASVKILGPGPAIRINVNPLKMAQYHINFAQLDSALEKQNRIDSIGIFSSKNTQIPVILNSNLSSALAFQRIALRNSAHGLIHLSDVADVSQGTDTDQIKTFYQGEPATFLALHLSDHVEALRVFKHLREQLEILKTRFPVNLKIHSLINGEQYLSSSLMEMIKTLIFSLTLISILMLIIFQNYRSALVILFTIPMALLGSGVMLLYFGCSLNLLTLLAMILLMGLLADDAIVVFENINRHVSMGKKPFDAALVATREIAKPIIFISCSLVILFFPIFFMQGIIGRLFWEFSLVLVSSVLISAGIALGLIPMFCIKFRLLGHNNDSLLMTKIKLLYTRSLLWAFSQKKIVIFAWLISIFFGIYSFLSTPKNFSPQENFPLLQLIAEAPKSSNITYLEIQANRLMNTFKTFKEVEQYNLILGVPNPHQILSFLHATPMIQKSLQDKLDLIPGLTVKTFVPSLMPGTQGLPLEFVMSGITDYHSLDIFSSRMVKNARKSGLFLFVDRDLHFDQPVKIYEINGELASSLNIAQDSIEPIIQNLANQNSYHYYLSHNQIYPILIQMNSSMSEMMNPFYLKNKQGNLIPLSFLLRSREAVEPSELNQFQGLNSVSISAAMKPSHSISEGIEFFEQNAKEILPRNIQSDFIGNARVYLQESQKALELWGAAFLLIFFLLSIQFENFIDPMIILFGSIPSAFAGALFPLKLGFSGFNVYSQIALLVLSGLIAKHGILITEFANQNFRISQNKEKAAFEAALIRFRPILVTSISLILGAVPLIFSSGGGSSARFSFGIILFFGMIIGGFFSLFVLPIFYVLGHPKERRAYACHRSR